jgi:hypothetical protein
MGRQQRAPRCPHQPRCPAASRRDRAAARVVCARPEQGWSLLCNGVIVFDDTGELLPDGTVIDPRVPAPRTELVRAAAAARRGGEPGCGRGARGGNAAPAHPGGDPPAPPGLGLQPGAGQLAAQLPPGSPTPVMSH